jgi:hypothetical protein
MASSNAMPTRRMNVADRQPKFICVIRKPSAIAVTTSEDLEPNPHIRNDVSNCDLAVPAPVREVIVGHSIPFTAQFIVIKVASNQARVVTISNANAKHKNTPLNASTVPPEM